MARESKTGFYQSVYQVIDAGTGGVCNGIVWRQREGSQRIVRGVHLGYFNNDITANLNQKNVMGRFVVAKGTFDDANVAQLLLTFNAIEDTTAFAAAFRSVKPIVEYGINDFGTKLYKFERPLLFLKEEPALIIVFAGYRQADVYGTPSQSIVTFMVEGETLQKEQQPLGTENLADWKLR